MKKRAGIIIFLIFVFIINCTQTLQAKEDEKERVFIYYFYINTCETCSEAGEVVDHHAGILKSASPKHSVHFLSFNITEEKNLLLLQEFFEAYNVPIVQQKVPILFAGHAYYSEQEEISKGLDEITILLKANSDMRTLWSDEAYEGELQLKKAFKGIQVFQVITVGFINGLNPCSLSMVLFFLSLLLAHKRLKVLRIGLAFVLGKLLTYLLIGTIFYHILGMVDLEKYQYFVKIAIAMFVIVLAYLNIRDYYYAKSEQYGKIKNQLPSKIRKWNHQIITEFANKKGEIGLLILSFFLGVVISIGEFLCTGQVYLASIVYIFKTQSDISVQAFLYLLLYSVSFSIPTIFVVVFIARTRKLLEISERIRSKMPMIKLTTAIVLIIAGILIILL